MVDDSPTLFLPRQGTQGRGDTHSGWTLTPELRDQITRRLQLVAITYALAFVFADLLPTFLMVPLQWWRLEPASWIPAVVAILVGVGVAVVARQPSMSWQTKIRLGLVFEVVASYGIALAQYLNVPDLRSQPTVLFVLSPSWVAIWMLFYSTVVPAPPRASLIALVASASAAPVVLWGSLRLHGLGDLMPPGAFLLHHVLPYAICVAMAYAAARIVYRLGAEVSRAQELGSYRLVERLGSGGMGEVWKATHRLLARPAAIKFIRPEAFAGVDATEARALLRRFELEARSTAALTSAHTVRLYDFGVTDGSFYYVMELLDGLDADALVRRFGPLPPARVVHLLAQACESLEEAHAAGFIHRDVKPANLYVCRSGVRHDFVKVLDFGLVVHRPAGGPEGARLTVPDQAIGTPQFMPPEVALGRSVDARADLYALGCVAYWLATGRPVFEGAGTYEIVSNHLHVAPAPPSRHAPQPLPPELDALVLACLEKEPERRPGSAREVADRLRAIPLADRWGDEEARAWWAAAGAGARMSARAAGVSAST
jgi:eukaryotic-like serine/threonine-protein kinase